MMRFMTLVKSAERSGPPPTALMDASAQLGDEATSAGMLLATGGLAPSAMSTRIRLSGGQLAVLDGPFTEAKEVVGGFAIYEVSSKDEAVAAARRFMELHQEHWPGWEGEIEIRQVFGPEDVGPGH